MVFHPWLKLKIPENTHYLLILSFLKGLNHEIMFFIFWWPIALHHCIQRVGQYSYTNMLLVSAIQQSD